MEVALRLLIQPYSNPCDAVHEACGENIEHNAVKFSEAVEGRRCTAVTWRKDGVCFQMEHEAIEVDIDSQTQTLRALLRGEAPKAEKAPNAREWVVRWKDRTEVWRRAELLERCVGQRLRDVFYNGNELYLYWEGLDDCLCFHPACETESGCPVLYWYFTE